jgi:CRP/FNR family transcriptional regulator, dissimilatory nitrate respiration regulator
MTLSNPLADKQFIRAELKLNTILRDLSEPDLLALEHELSLVECPKGEYLLHQGVQDMHQYFIIEGVLKRVVDSPEGKQMILRFACERDMETSYAAWRLGTPTPYSVVAVSKVRVAKLPMLKWVAFMNQHEALKAHFEHEVMRLMSDVLAHTITLHLLDAPGRVNRFGRKHPELLERIPKKELATYLNLSAETLSRLKQRGKI